MKKLWDFIGWAGFMVASVLLSLSILDARWVSAAIAGVLAISCVLPVRHDASVGFPGAHRSSTGLGSYGTILGFLAVFFLAAFGLGLWRMTNGDDKVAVPLVGGGVGLVFDLVTILVLVRRSSTESENHGPCNGEAR